MSVAQLLSMLRNQLLVQSELEDKNISITEVIYNDKPHLEIDIETEDGMKSFHVDFKQVYKPKVLA